MPDRSRVRELSAEYTRKGGPTGWFDRLYQEAAEGKTHIPWDDRAPNPHLVSFMNRHAPHADGKRALVIGCGLGDDAQYLQDAGFSTTAFDISPTAIAAAVRFPHSRVTFVAAALFQPPVAWTRDFHFIFEANTLQALPAAIRSEAIEKIAASVAPGGTLLVVARARDESDPPGEIPWPLTRSELDTFKAAGLLESTFEDFHDSEDSSSVRRFRISYTRAK